jgi:hypothetical protein
MDAVKLSYALRARSRVPDLPLGTPSTKALPGPPAGCPLRRTRIERTGPRLPNSMRSVGVYQLSHTGVMGVITRTGDLSTRSNG